MLMLTVTVVPIAEPGVRITTGVNDKHPRNFNNILDLVVNVYFIISLFSQAKFL